MNCHWGFAICAVIFLASLIGLMWHEAKVVKAYYKTSHYIHNQCTVRNITMKYTIDCELCHWKNEESGWVQNCCTSSYPCYNISVTYIDDSTTTKEQRATLYYDLSHRYRTLQCSMYYCASKSTGNRQHIDQWVTSLNQTQTIDCYYNPGDITHVLHEKKYSYAWAVTGIVLPSLVMIFLLSLYIYIYCLPKGVRQSHQERILSHNSHGNMRTELEGVTHTLLMMRLDNSAANQTHNQTL